MNKELLIKFIIYIAVLALIIGIGACSTKAIVESDLPTWLKIFLLK